MNDAHYELIGRFKNLDEAVTNFMNSEKNTLNNIITIKIIYLETFMPMNCFRVALFLQIQKDLKENTLLLSYLTDVVIRYLCLSDLSKKKELNDANLVDYFYKFKRVYPLYSSFTPFMQKKISNNILILLKKIDPNSAFNSLYFLNN